MPNALEILYKLEQVLKFVLHRNLSRLFRYNAALSGKPPRLFSVSHKLLFYGARQDRTHHTGTQELDVSVSAHSAVKSIDSLVQHIIIVVFFFFINTINTNTTCSCEAYPFGTIDKARLTEAAEQFIMKHLAAYLLLGLGGNTSPSAEDVKGVLASVGIDADEERLDKLIAELKGKDLQEVYNISLSEVYHVHF